MSVGNAVGTSLEEVEEALVSKGVPTIFILADNPDEDDINDTTTFERIATVTAPGDGPAGIYELVATGEFSVDINTSDYEGRLTSGNNQMGQSIRLEFKDQFGTGVDVDGDNSGTDQRSPLHMRRLVVLAENSTDTYGYEHRATVNGIEATTFDLQLTLEFKRPV